MGLRSSSGTQAANVASVTPEFFRSTAPVPLAGRLFVPADYAAGARPAVILPERYWRQMLGADANALGKTLSINGREFAIVGVLPSSFDVPSGVDFWIPSVPIQEWPKSEEQSQAIVTREQAPVHKAAASPFQAATTWQVTGTFKGALVSWVLHTYPDTTVRTTDTGGNGVNGTGHWRYDASRRTLDVNGLNLWLHVPFRCLFTLSDGRSDSMRGTCTDSLGTEYVADGARQ